MLKKFIALFGAQDMTVGSPLKCLLQFSVPLLIGNILQMLYFTIDSIVVGKVIGDPALAAIGVSAPIQNLFLVFFMAIGAGVTVMTSQYFGAKDFGKLGDTIGNSITLIAITSVFITAVTTPLTGAMLRANNAPPEILDTATVYLRILFIGAAANGFYNVLSGVLRGLGESFFPFIVLFFTALLNTGLDIWFVAGFRWGMAGRGLGHRDRADDLRHCLSCEDHDHAPDRRDQAPHAEAEKNNRQACGAARPPVRTLHGNHVLRHHHSAVGHQ